MVRFYFFACLLLVGCRLSGQDWKTTATDAIHTHRTAPVRISVDKGVGEPAIGAKIHLKMRNHHFRWGTIVDVPLFSQLEQQGWDRKGDHPYFLHFRHFNSVTPGNAGKWKSWINPTTRSRYQSIMSWFSSIGIANRGHTTIWPSISRWNAVPDTLLQAQAIVENGVEIRSKQDVMRDIIQGHIENQLPVLADHGVYDLDLVNELIHENEIVNDLMELPKAEHAAEHSQWYQWAKAAAPDVRLVANEYDLFQSGNNFHTTFVDYIQKMLARGAPVEAIGMQGHFFSTIPDYPELKRRLDEVAVLGLPMAVTEFDMLHNTYEEMERVLYAVFSEPLVEGFSFWGAWDGRQWRNNSAVFTTNWDLKPSGKAWFDLVKRTWWTDTLHTLTHDLPFETDAFLGTYDVYVEYEGQVAIRQLELDKAGAELTIHWNEEDQFPVPQAMLQVAGDPVEVYLNEPVPLSILSSDTVASVIFYEDDHILAVDKQPPFEYTFNAGNQPILKLSAEVNFRNGYSLRTPVQLIAVNTQNTRPYIETVFPPAGSAVLAQDTINLYVTAQDADADPVRISLYDQLGGLIASHQERTAKFDLVGLDPGTHHLSIKVEDDKFGSREMQYAINLLADQPAGILTVSPSAANDDVEEDLDDRGIDLTGDLDLGEKITGIFFPLTGVLKEAQIDSAFVQFTNQKPNQTGTSRVLFYGELSTSAIPFRTGKGDLSARNRTEEFVSWDLPDWTELDQQGPKQRSPDIGPVLREMIEQDGWMEQSRLHLLIDPASGPSKRSAYSYDLDEQKAPVLQVHYSLNIATQQPQPPAGFSFVPTGAAAGTLSWTSPELTESIWGYRLYLNGVEITELIRTQNFRLSDLEPDQLYTVRAQTLGKFGIWSDLSNEFEFSISTTGIRGSGIDARQWISVFPNPVKDHLQIRLKHPEQSPLNWQLTDAAGKIHYAGNFSGAISDLDVSDLSPGIYWLRVSVTATTYGFLRIVKQ